MSERVVDGKFEVTITEQKVTIELFSLIEVEARIASEQNRINDATAEKEKYESIKERMIQAGVRE